jgi:endonuclease/exonuclease/phosphatase family metal-dependent hydrolase
VAVDATVEGKTIRFVNTRLEPADYTDFIQAGQLAELQQLLGNESMPVVLVGDLNSEADGRGTPTYQSLLTAGFMDVHGLDPTPDGDALTCCHDLALRNSSVQLSKRIDHILLGNTPVAPEVDAWIVGDDLADKTRSGLWPSDHAGVVARLTFQGN